MEPSYAEMQLMTPVDYSTEIMNKVKEYANVCLIKSRISELKFSWQGVIAAGGHRLLVRFIEALEPVGGYASVLVKWYDPVSCDSGELLVLDSDFKSVRYHSQMLLAPASVKMEVCVAKLTSHFLLQGLEDLNSDLDEKSHRKISNLSLPCSESHSAFDSASQITVDGCDVSVVLVAVAGMVSMIPHHCERSVALNFRSMPPLEVFKKFHKRFVLHSATHKRFVVDILQGAAEGVLEMRYAEVNQPNVKSLIFASEDVNLESSEYNLNNEKTLLASCQKMLATHLGLDGAGETTLLHSDQHLVCECAQGHLSALTHSWTGVSSILVPPLGTATVVFSHLQFVLKTFSTHFVVDILENPGTGDVVLRYFDPLVLVHGRLEISLKELNVAGINDLNSTAPALKVMACKDILKKYLDHQTKLKYIFKALDRRYFVDICLSSFTALVKYIDPLECCLGCMEPSYAEMQIMTPIACSTELLNKVKEYANVCLIKSRISELKFFWQGVIAAGGHRLLVRFVEALEPVGGLYFISVKWYDPVSCDSGEFLVLDTDFEFVGYHSQMLLVPASVKMEVCVAKLTSHFLLQGLEDLSSDLDEKSHRKISNLSLPRSESHSVYDSASQITVDGCDVSVVLVAVAGMVSMIPHRCERALALSFEPMPPVELLKKFHKRNVMSVGHQRFVVDIFEQAEEGMLEIRYAEVNQPHSKSLTVAVADLNLVDSDFVANNAQVLIASCQKVLATHLGLDKASETTLSNSDEQLVCAGTQGDVSSLTHLCVGVSGIYVSPLKQANLVSSHLQFVIKTSSSHFVVDILENPGTGNIVLRYLDALVLVSGRLEIFANQLKVAGIIDLNTADPALKVTACKVILQEYLDQQIRLKYIFKAVDRRYFVDVCLSSFSIMVKYMDSLQCCVGFVEPTFVDMNIFAPADLSDETQAKVKEYINMFLIKSRISELMFFWQGVIAAGGHRLLVRFAESSELIEGASSISVTWFDPVACDAGELLVLDTDFEPVQYQSQMLLVPASVKMEVCVAKLSGHFLLQGLKNVSSDLDVKNQHKCSNMSLQGSETQVDETSVASLVLVPSVGAISIATHQLEKAVVLDLGGLLIHELAPEVSCRFAINLAGHSQHFVVDVFENVSEQVFSIRYMEVTESESQTVHVSIGDLEATGLVEAALNTWSAKLQACRQFMLQLLESESLRTQIFDAAEREIQLLVAPTVGAGSFAAHCLGQAMLINLTHLGVANVVSHHHQFVLSCRNHRYLVDLLDGVDNASFVLRYIDPIQCHSNSLMISLSEVDGPGCLNRSLNFAEKIRACQGILLSHLLSQLIPAPSCGNASFKSHFCSASVLVFGQGQSCLFDLPLHTIPCGPVSCLSHTICLPAPVIVAAVNSVILFDTKSVMFIGGKRLLVQTKEDLQRHTISVQASRSDAMQEAVAFEITDTDFKNFGYKGPILFLPKISKMQVCKLMLTQHMFVISQRRVAREEAAQKMREVEEAARIALEKEKEHAHQLEDALSQEKQRVAYLEAALQAALAAQKRDQRLNTPRSSILISKSPELQFVAAARLDSCLEAIYQAKTSKVEMLPLNVIADPFQTYVVENDACASRAFNFSEVAKEKLNELKRYFHDFMSTGDEFTMPLIIDGAEVVQRMRLVKRNTSYCLIDSDECLYTTFEEQIKGNQFVQLHSQGSSHSIQFDAHSSCILYGDERLRYGGRFEMFGKTVQIIRGSVLLMFKNLDEAVHAEPISEKHLHRTASVSNEEQAIVGVPIVHPDAPVYDDLLAIKVDSPLGSTQISSIACAVSSIITEEIPLALLPTDAVRKSATNYVISTVSSVRMSKIKKVPDLISFAHIAMSSGGRHLLVDMKQMHNGCGLAALIFDPIAQVSWQLVIDSELLGFLNCFTVLNNLELKSKIEILRFLVHCFFSRLGMFGEEQEQGGTVASMNRGKHSHNKTHVFAEDDLFGLSFATFPLRASDSLFLICSYRMRELVLFQYYNPHVSQNSHISARFKEESPVLAKLEGHLATSFWNGLISKLLKSKKLVINLILNKYHHFVIDCQALSQNVLSSVDSYGNFDLEGALVGDQSMFNILDHELPLDLASKKTSKSDSLNFLCPIESKGSVSSTSHIISAVTLMKLQCFEPEQRASSRLVRSFSAGFTTSRPESSMMFSRLSPRMSMRRTSSDFCLDMSLDLLDLFGIDPSMVTASVIPASIVWDFMPEAFQSYVLPGQEVSRRTSLRPRTVGDEPETKPLATLQSFNSHCFAVISLICVDRISSVDAFPDLFLAAPHYDVSMLGHYSSRASTFSVPTISIRTLFEDSTVCMRDPYDCTISASTHLSSQSTSFSVPSISCISYPECAFVSASVPSVISAISHQCCSASSSQVSFILVQAVSKHSIVSYDYRISSICHTVSKANICSVSLFPASFAFKYSTVYHQISRVTFISVPFLEVSNMGPPPFTYGLSTLSHQISKISTSSVPHISCTSSLEILPLSCKCGVSTNSHQVSGVVSLSAPHLENANICPTAFMAGLSTLSHQVCQVSVFLVPRISFAVSSEILPATYEYGVSAVSHEVSRVVPLSASFFNTITFLRPPSMYGLSTLSHQVSTISTFFVPCFSFTSFEMLPLSSEYGVSTISHQVARVSALSAPCLDVLTLVPTGSNFGLSTLSYQISKVSPVLVPHISFYISSQILPITFEYGVATVSHQVSRVIPLSVTCLNVSTVLETPFAYRPSTLSHQISKVRAVLVSCISCSLSSQALPIACEYEVSTVSHQISRVVCFSPPILKASNVVSCFKNGLSTFPHQVSKISTLFVPCLSVSTSFEVLPLCCEYGSSTISHQVSRVVPLSVPFLEVSTILARSSAYELSTLSHQMSQVSLVLVPQILAVTFEYGVSPVSHQISRIIHFSVPILEASNVIPSCRYTLTTLSHQVSKSTSFSVPCLSVLSSFEVLPPVCEYEVSTGSHQVSRVMCVSVPFLEASTVLPTSFTYGMSTLSHQISNGRSVLVPHISFTCSSINLPIWFEYGVSTISHQVSRVLSLSVPHLKSSNIVPPLFTYGSSLHSHQMSKISTIVVPHISFASSSEILQVTHEHGLSAVSHQVFRVTSFSVPFLKVSIISPTAFTYKLSTLPHQISKVNTLLVSDILMRPSAEKKSSAFENGVSLCSHQFSNVKSVCVPCLEVSASIPTSFACKISTLSHQVTKTSTVLASYISLCLSSEIVPDAFEYGISLASNQVSRISALTAKVIFAVHKPPVIAIGRIVVVQGKTRLLTTLKHLYEHNQLSVSFIDAISRSSGHILVDRETLGFLGLFIGFEMLDRKSQVEILRFVLCSHLLQMQETDTSSCTLDSSSILTLTFPLCTSSSMFLVSGYMIFDMLLLKYYDTQSSSLTFVTVRFHHNSSIFFSLVGETFKPFWYRFILKLVKSQQLRNNIVSREFRHFVFDARALSQTLDTVSLGVLNFDLEGALFGDESMLQSLLSDVPRAVHTPSKPFEPASSSPHAVWISNSCTFSELSHHILGTSQLQLPELCLHMGPISATSHCTAGVRALEFASILLSSKLNDGSSFEIKSSKRSTSCQLKILHALGYTPSRSSHQISKVMSVSLPCFKVSSPGPIPSACRLSPLAHQVTKTSTVMARYISLCSVSAIVPDTFEYGISMASNQVSRISGLNATELFAVRKPPVIAIGRIVVVQGKTRLLATMKHSSEHNQLSVSFIDPISRSSGHILVDQKTVGFLGLFTRFGMLDRNSQVEILRFILCSHLVQMQETDNSSSSLENSLVLTLTLPLCTTNTMFLVSSYMIFDMLLLKYYDTQSSSLTFVTVRFHHNSSIFFTLVGETFKPFWYRFILKLVKSQQLRNNIVSREFGHFVFDARALSQTLDATSTGLLDFDLESALFGDESMLQSLCSDVPRAVHTSPKLCEAAVPGPDSVVGRTSNLSEPSHHISEASQLQVDGLHLHVGPISATSHYTTGIRALDLTSLLLSPMWNDDNFFDSERTTTSTNRRFRKSHSLGYNHSRSRSLTIHSSCSTRSSDFSIEINLDVESLHHMERANSLPVSTVWDFMPEVSILCEDLKLIHRSSQGSVGSAGHCISTCSAVGMSLLTARTNGDADADTTLSEVTLHGELHGEDSIRSAAARATHHICGVSVVSDESDSISNLSFLFGAVGLNAHQVVGVTNVYSYGFFEDSLLFPFPALGPVGAIAHQISNTRAIFDDLYFVQIQYKSTGSCASLTHQVGGTSSITGLVPVVVSSLHLKHVAKIFGSRFLCDIVCEGKNSILVKFADVFAAISRTVVVETESIVMLGLDPSNLTAENKCQLAVWAVRKTLVSLEFKHSQKVVVEVGRRRHLAQFRQSNEFINTSWFDPLGSDHGELKISSKEILGEDFQGHLSDVSSSIKIEACQRILAEHLLARQQRPQSSSPEVEEQICHFVPLCIGEASFVSHVMCKCTSLFVSLLPVMQQLAESVPQNCSAFSSTHQVACAIRFERLAPVSKAVESTGPLSALAHQVSLSFSVKFASLDLPTQHIKHITTILGTRYLLDIHPLNENGSLHVKYTAIYAWVTKELTVEPDSMRMLGFDPLSLTAMNICSLASWAVHKIVSSLDIRHTDKLVVEFRGKRHLAHFRQSTEFVTACWIDPITAENGELKVPCKEILGASHSGRLLDASPLIKIQAYKRILTEHLLARSRRPIPVSESEFKTLPAASLGNCSFTSHLGACSVSVIIPSLVISTCNWPSLFSVPTPAHCVAAAQRFCELAPLQALVETFSPISMKTHEVTSCVAYFGLSPITAVSLHLKHVAKIFGSRFLFDILSEEGKSSLQVNFTDVYGGVTRSVTVDPENLIVLGFSNPTALNAQEKCRVAVWAVRKNLISLEFKPSKKVVVVVGGKRHLAQFRQSNEFINTCWFQPLELECGELKISCKEIVGDDFHGNLSDVPPAIKIEACQKILAEHLLARSQQAQISQPEFELEECMQGDQFCAMQEEMVALDAQCSGDISFGCYLVSKPQKITCLTVKLQEELTQMGKSSFLSHVALSATAIVVSPILNLDVDLAIVSPKVSFSHGAELCHCVSPALAMGFESPLALVPTPVGPIAMHTHQISSIVCLPEFASLPVFVDSHQRVAVTVLGQRFLIDVTSFDGCTSLEVKLTDSYAWLNDSLFVNANDIKMFGLLPGLLTNANKVALARSALNKFFISKRTHPVERSVFEIRKRRYLVQLRNEEKALFIDWIDPIVPKAGHLKVTIADFALLGFRGGISSAPPLMRRQICRKLLSDHLLGPVVVSEPAFEEDGTPRPSIAEIPRTKDIRKALRNGQFSFQAHSTGLFKAMVVAAKPIRIAKEHDPAAYGLRFVHNWDVSPKLKIIGSTLKSYKLLCQVSPSKAPVLNRKPEEGPALDPPTLKKFDEGPASDPPTQKKLDESFGVNSLYTSNPSDWVMVSDGGSTNKLEYSISEAGDSDFEMDFDLEGFDDNFEDDFEYDISAFIPKTVFESWNPRKKVLDETANWLQSVAKQAKAAHFYCEDMCAILGQKLKERVDLFRFMSGKRRLVTAKNSADGLKFQICTQSTNEISHLTVQNFVINLKVPTAEEYKQEQQKASEQLTALLLEQVLSSWKEASIFGKLCSIKVAAQTDAVLNSHCLLLTASYFDELLQTTQEVVFEIKV